MTLKILGPISRELYQLGKNMGATNQEVWAIFQEGEEINYGA